MFFRLIASQHELLSYHQKYGLPRNINYFLTTIDSKVDVEKEEEKEALLQSLYEMQRALDLEPMNYNFLWNLGLIKLWQSSLNEVQKIWQVAIEQAQQKKQNLCTATYQCTRYALDPSSFTSFVSFETWLRKVDENRDQARPGYVKMTLKDLEAVKLVLFRNLLIESLKCRQVRQKIDRFYEAHGKITRLQNQLRQALRS